MEHDTGRPERLRWMIGTTFDVALSIEALINPTFSPEDLAPLMTSAQHQRLQDGGPRAAALFRAIGAVFGDAPTGAPVVPVAFQPYNPDDLTAKQTAGAAVYAACVLAGMGPRSVGPGGEPGPARLTQDEFTRSVVVDLFAWAGGNPRAVKARTEEVADYLDRLLAAVSASKDR